MFGFAARVIRLRIDKQKSLDSRIKNPGEFIWRLDMWRFESVKGLLRILPLWREEKMAKAMIARRLELRPIKENRLMVIQEWYALIDTIDSDCKTYVARAKDAWEAKTATRQIK